jgi:hypothetical protein
MYLSFTPKTLLLLSFHELGCDPISVPAKISCGFWWKAVIGIATELFGNVEVVKITIKNNNVGPDYTT